MSMSQFDNIRVVVAEPNSQLRTGLKESLQGLGFKAVVGTGNMSRVVSAVDAGDVDLLIADTSLPEGDFNTYVHELRHGHQGCNPFLVVVTLVNQPSSDAVHKAIDSGTDHVLAKPFTVEALVSKITDLTHARKRFVVTTDYIGPDRRSTHRAGTMQIPLIDVPNPLQHRMSGHTSENQVRHSIENAKLKINEQKVLRHAYQIGWLLDRVLPEMSAMTSSIVEDQTEHLNKLCLVSRDLCARIRGTRYANVAEMCMTLSHMAQTAMREGLNEADMQLMGRMGKIVEQAFDPERDAKATEYQRKFHTRGHNVFQKSEKPDLTQTPSGLVTSAVG